MQLNIENINRVIEAIKADGKAFKMLNFVQSESASAVKDNYGNPRQWDCGTAMCIAGWANLIRLEDAGNKPKLNTGGSDPYHNEFARQFANEDRAAHWLGFDGSYEARPLFYMSYNCWDGQHERNQFDALPDDVRSKAGIYVLEHLRDTGAIDWPAAIEKAQQS